MDSWEVLLKDPTSKRTIHKAEIEASTEYGAKKEFFQLIIKTNPKLSPTPFSAVLPHIKVKKLINGYTKTPTSEFSLENFLTDVKKTYKTKDPLEDLRGSSYLPDLVKYITEEGIQTGKIPNKCPICRRPTESLWIHHWTNETISEVLVTGKYKRMCPSCNSSLGTIFKGNYPLKWENQLKKLLQYFKTLPKTYKNIQEKEEPWAHLSNKEWDLIIKIWENTPPRILRALHREPKKSRENKIIETT